MDLEPDTLLFLLLLPLLPLLQEDGLGILLPLPLSPLSRLLGQIHPTPPDPVGTTTILLPLLVLVIMEVSTITPLLLLALEVTTTILLLLAVITATMAPLLLVPGAITRLFHLATEPPTTGLTLPTPRSPLDTESLVVQLSVLAVVRPPRRCLMLTTARSGTIWYVLDSRIVLIIRLSINFPIMGPIWPELLKLADRPMTAPMSRPPITQVDYPMGSKDKVVVNAVKVAQRNIAQHYMRELQLDRNDALTILRGLQGASECS